jgi:hypothetical protein
MKYKTHVVIPIGVAAPGTPVLSLLRASIDCVLGQSTPDVVLTIASDSDVSEECKSLLDSYGEKINVRWFEPASFFRRGGIWKKYLPAGKRQIASTLLFFTTMTYGIARN